jgi:predicted  nucleic acid-binding Zn-ribbon protein
VHILTKVFVLFASVLSIMMAALAISYSVNADRITADYRDAVATAVTASNDLAAVKAAQGQEKAALQDDLSSLQDELASRDADSRRLEASNSELRIALRQAEAARESISSKIAQLGVTTETQAKIIDEYKTELGRLREAELSWRNDKIDIEKSLSDLESQVIVYEQVNRSLRERIAELQTAFANAATGNSSDSSSVSSMPTEVAGPLIRGSIDEVMTDPASGDTLVKINLGTNDRIQANTRLYIHRGNSIYLGELVIFQVDLNHAVGTVTYVAQNQSIRAGDQVMSKIGS